MSNGFDAFAEAVFVYIPGEFVTDKVIVWDNGLSMDVEQLKQLWWIARSPKDDGADRIREAGGRTRAMIGKFGIGKLACYAIGDRVTHLCKRDGRYLSVTVDYSEVPKLEGGEPAKKYVTPIRELTEDEARSTIEEAFDGAVEPAAMSMFEEAHWTVAFIDEFRSSTRLTPGRLRWVISNGMPLRPDFRVFLGDEEVSSKIEKSAVVTWDMGSAELQESITGAWKGGNASGVVSGVPDFAVNADGRPVVQLAELGDVRTEVRLFPDSLRKSGDEGQEENRSYGFFIMVRDRLINPDDPQVFLQPPSYGTFYRSQYVVYADGLDSILLADREHLVADAPKCRELALLQRAIYLASRTAIEDLDQTKEHEQRSESLLPTGSRDQYRGPLGALLGRDGISPDAKLLSSPTIEHANLSPEAPLSVISEDQSSFQINTEHPFVKAIENTVGSGKKAREILRAIDILAVSERLLEGYLYDLGIPDDQVAMIVTWRDGLLSNDGTSTAGKP